jgi:hypothetical protein
MGEISTSRLTDILQRCVGPAPWYWKTFPPFHSLSGQRWVWTHHGEQGPLAYLVSLGLEQEARKPRLALNTYCRPFFVPPSHIGIWCPEGRSIRLTCFDPEQLKGFELAEIVGWFKPSSERIYAATTPMADFEVSLALPAGMHKIDVPRELRGVDEVIIPTSYPAKGPDQPAFALYVVYLQAGLVEVLPQKWFTGNQYQVGKQWITRAARDPESHRILGESFGTGSFLLEEDGCRLERWLERSAQGDGRFR